jgi:hypothetical protein
MAEFTIEITDARHLAGITAAREARNAAVPEDEQLETDAEYVQFVMTGAAESYANQYGD